MGNLRPTPTPTHSNPVLFEHWVSNKPLNAVKMLVKCSILFMTFMFTSTLNPYKRVRVD
jgi:hypothetical protein